MCQPVVSPTVGLGGLGALGARALIEFGLGQVCSAYSVPSSPVLSHRDPPLAITPFRRCLGARFERRDLLGRPVITINADIVTEFVERRFADLMYM